MALCVSCKEREDPRVLARLEIESPDPATKGGVVEEKDTKDAQSEEVEGHTLAQRPIAETPVAERKGEEAEVEGHALTESPVAERKGEDPEVEGHAMTERPVAERPVAE
jgi:hypothetical protein